ncbi:MAG: hypothetical protein L6277_13870 [Desulfobacterales bacterium]|nr:hypothetical protein [Desulfobacterales bacterium]
MSLYLILCAIFCSPLNCHAATSIPCGGAAAGSITAAAQVDTYTFTAAAGDVITIRAARVTGDTNYFNIVLELDAPDGSLVGTGTWQIDKTLTASGTYTVKARDDNNTHTGTYILTWQKVNNPCNATALNAGEVAVGDLGQTVDNPPWRYYSFTGAAGDVVTLRAARTAGDTNYFNVYLELFAPNGTRIGNALWQIDQTLPQNGTYTILVRDDNTTQAGSFALDWQRLTNPVNATPLNCGEMAAGNLGQTMENPPYRYYSFTGAVGDLVTLRAARTAGDTIYFNVYLELFAPNGTRIGNGLADRPDPAPERHLYNSGPG